MCSVARPLGSVPLLPPLLSPLLFPVPPLLSLLWTRSPLAWLLPALLRVLWMHRWRCAGIGWLWLCYACGSPPCPPPLTAMLHLWLFLPAAGGSARGSAPPCTIVHPCSVRPHRLPLYFTRFRCLVHIPHPARPPAPRPPPLAPSFPRSSATASFCATLYRSGSLGSYCSVGFVFVQLCVVQFITTSLLTSTDSASDCVAQKKVCVCV